MIFVLVLILAIALIGASPLALDLFGGETPHWERLSFIGQTYGAASALLAVLALIGVTLSLIFQARESRATREQAFRASNSEMLKMAMDDPAYAECWGGVLEPGNLTEQRQSMYVNMILTQWEMGYETGAVGETHIRALAAQLFEGRVPWEFWRRTRELRIKTAESRRARRFQLMIDDEFRRVPEPPEQSAGPAPAGPPGPDAAGGRDGRRALWFALGAGAGLAVTAAVVRRVVRLGGSSGGRGRASGW